MNKFLIALSTLALVGCSQPQHATQALQDAGYTEIHTTGYSWFGCGRDDDFSTGFVARSVSGQCVHGVVCGGFLKGDTIRTQGRVSDAQCSVVTEH